jgi:hypothetical protein
VASSVAGLVDQLGPVVRQHPPVEPAVDQLGLDEGTQSRGHRREGDVLAQHPPGHGHDLLPGLAALARPEILLEVERLGVGDAVVAPTLEVRDQPTWDDRREDGFGIGTHLRVAAPGRAPQPGLGVPVPCRVLREKPTKVVRSLRRERFRRVLGRVAEDGLDRLPMFGIVLKQQAQVVGRAWDRAGRLQRTRL